MGYNNTHHFENESSEDNISHFNFNYLSKAAQKYGFISPHLCRTLMRRASEVASTNKADFSLPFPSFCEQCGTYLIPSHTSITFISRLRTKYGSKKLRSYLSNSCYTHRTLKPKSCIKNIMVYKCLCCGYKNLGGGILLSSNKGQERGFFRTENPPIATVHTQLNNFSPSAHQHMKNSRSVKKPKSPLPTFSILPTNSFSNSTNPYSPTNCDTKDLSNSENPNYKNLEKPCSSLFNFNSPNKINEITLNLHTKTERFRNQIPSHILESFSSSSEQVSIAYPQISRLSQSLNTQNLPQHKTYALTSSSSTTSKLSPPNIQAFSPLSSPLPFSPTSKTKTFLPYKDKLVSTETSNSFQSQAKHTSQCLYLSDPNLPSNFNNSKAYEHIIASSACNDSSSDAKSISSKPFSSKSKGHLPHLLTVPSLLPFSNVEPHKSQSIHFPKNPHSGYPLNQNHKSIRKQKLPQNTQGSCRNSAQKFHSDINTLRDIENISNENSISSTITNLERSLSNSLKSLPTCNVEIYPPSTSNSTVCLLQENSKIKKENNLYSIFNSIQTKPR